MTAPAQPGTVYLLHIEPAYHHARHYAGWTDASDPARRVAEHLAGQGSPLIRAALAAGRQITLVLAVPGDRKLERRWHNRHGSRLCPRCKAQRPRPRQYRLPFPRSAGGPLGASVPPVWRLSHAA